MVSRGKRSAGKFDAYRLAADRAVVEGRVDAHALQRVADLLSDGPATIGWRIEGFTDASGRPALRIALKGTVPLTCQRCLAEFAWSVDHATEVLLARDEKKVAALDALSSLEVVHASGPIDALALVEDELVLTVPFAPRHPEGACDGTITQ